MYKVRKPLRPYRGTIICTLIEELQWLDSTSVRLNVICVRVIIKGLNPPCLRLYRSFFGYFIRI